jgi:hypothetical protein
VDFSEITNIWICRYPVDNDSGQVNVFPSYYAYLFVAETIGSSRTMRMANIYPGRQSNGSTITYGDESAGQVSIYGFWENDDTEYPTKLAILNMQIYNSTQTDERPQLTVDLSSFAPPSTKAIARRLIAPGADVKTTSETTWAGQTFAQGTAEGDLVEETVGEDFVISIAASEAVLVTFQN